MEVDGHNSQQKKKTQNKNQLPFKGGNNIVVAINKTSDIHVNFSQEKVRKVINNKFGPAIVELVNRYAFKSDNPRLMIQFKNRIIADEINDRWDKDLFEGSRSRLLIDPSEHNENSIMLKGVPIDSSNKEIKRGILKMDDGAQAERLNRKGQN